VSAAQVQAQRSYERWTSSVPLFGPLVSGLRQLSGYQTVAQELQEEQAAAAAELQAGATQYQDSYTIFLGDMAPQVYAVAKDVLGPGGYIDVVTQYATLPLVYAAHDLIAPVVALFCCALILVWAV
jgi:histidine ammonia-lyase